MEINNATERGAAKGLRVATTARQATIAIMIYAMYVIAGIVARIAKITQSANMAQKTQHCRLKLWKKGEREYEVQTMEKEL